MTVEREVKLAVPPSFHMPDIDGAINGFVASSQDDRRINTTYWDTADLGIARWGCQLRHRTGEGRGGLWTVKLPAEIDGEALLREEREFEGGPAKPPSAAVDLLRAYIRGAELRPVAKLQTLRRRVALRDGHGVAAGEVVDDEVSVLDGRRVAGRFREVEVELDPTVDEAVATSIVARLREAGAGASSSTPKHVHALGPQAAKAPELVVPELDEDPSIEEVLRGALTSSAIRLLRHDAGVRIGEDPEAVHQARVATRRLRSDLRTYRDLLDADWAAPLREDLGRLADALGRVRDADVLWERLRSHSAGLPEADAAVAKRLRTRLERTRQEARVALLAELRSTRYGQLLDRVVAGVQQPAVLDEARRPARATMAEVMDGPWRHLRAAFDALDADSANEELHAARIRAKRARYAAESTIPVFGKAARRFAEAAADVQEILGEHQDAVVADAWLRAAAPGAGSRTSFVSGELAAIERTRADAARAAWPAAWKQLSRKRMRFWT
ncbi:MAG: CYTH and CHAD domain-containing protein [Actinomycetota bacterium]